MLFKRCRRLWGWLSHLRQGRQLTGEVVDYLWFGTGIHYALEDFHGYNLYKHPARAFLAYVHATQEARILPESWAEHQKLGVAIMSYYADEWLRHRDPLTTYVEDGIPQVEVNFAIDLGVKTSDGRQALYGVTLDRVVIDEWDRLWIVEAKTAKQLRSLHLDVDDQVTGYAWAAWRKYGRPVAGVIYQQFLKRVPLMPKILSTGKVSTDKRQATSAALYAKVLTDIYGSPELSPPENIGCLNSLRAMEDEDRDKFIVRHRIERNENQLRSFEDKIHMELEDIANPNLPLYPNPAWTCDWCPLQVPCVAMDSKEDWEKVLEEFSQVTDDGLTAREKEQIKWRNLLPEPSKLPLLSEEAVQYQQLLSQLPDPEQQAGLSTEQIFLREIGL